MTHTVQLEKWDDQELDRLFAARLPVLSLPGGLAEQLTKAVFEEISRYITPTQDPTVSFPETPTQPVQHRRPLPPSCPQA